MSTIGIVGFGRFGELTARYLSKEFPVMVSTRSGKSDAIRACGAKPAAFETVCEQEIVILCMPISAMQEILMQASPLLKPDALVVDVCGKKLDKAGQDMIRVLVDNDRLELLPEIFRQYETYRAEAEKVVKAHVTSAFPVSSKQKSDIISALKKRLGREVTLECEVDKSLLGGAIIRAGDMVIDGSITGHLDRLTHALSQ